MDNIGLSNLLGGWSCLSERGQIGDMFGAVNALFSGLAFAGIIYTFIFQQKEIEKNAEDTTKQNERFNTQQFENKFFQLLSFHSQIVNSLDFRNKKHVVVSTGRDCLRTYYNQFKDANKGLKKKKTNGQDLNIVEVTDSYVKMFERREGDLGHYYRSLYHIILFIDESEIEHKYKYVRLVRAQVSSYESALIFYNCLSDYGDQQFKPLLEKYSVLKNMNWELLENHEDLYHYDGNAFGHNICHRISPLILQMGTTDYYEIHIKEKTLSLDENSKNIKTFEIKEQKHNATLIEVVDFILRKHDNSNSTWLPDKSFFRRLTTYIVGQYVIDERREIRVPTERPIDINNLYDLIMGFS